jgi:hypothetical protein
MWSVPYFYLLRKQSELHLPNRVIQTSLVKTMKHLIYPLLGKIKAWLLGHQEKDDEKAFETFSQSVMGLVQNKPT